MTLHQQTTDADLIAAHIAAKGVTRCPTAFAAVTTADVHPDDARIHEARGLDPVLDIWKRRNPGKSALGALWRQKRSLIKTGVKPTEAEATRLMAAVPTPLQRVALAVIIQAGSASNEAMASRMWGGSGKRRPNHWENAVEKRVGKVRRAIKPLGWNVTSVAGVFYLVRIDGGAR